MIRRLGGPVLVLLLLLLPAAWMTWTVLSGTAIGCEVCVEFRGRRQCRRAEGPDREACRRTAADNACGFLASGMNESIACGNTEPESVRFFAAGEEAY